MTPYHTFFFLSAQDDVAKIQGELSQVLEDHKKKITALESSLNESNTKHREEVAFFQNLLKEREEEDRARESERERQRQAEHASVTERVDEVRQNFVVQLENLRAELEENMERNKQEIAELQEGHQKELTKSQQEVENLREELAQKSLQHDEEMRALEEDFEIERDRLLLLHEELTEQLALKGTSVIYLMFNLNLFLISETKKCFSTQVLKHIYFLLYIYFNNSKCGDKIFTIILYIMNLYRCY